MFPKRSSISKTQTRWFEIQWNVRKIAQYLSRKTMPPNMANFHVKWAKIHLSWTLLTTYFFCHLHIHKSQTKKSIYQESNQCSRVANPKKKIENSEKIQMQPISLIKSFNLYPQSSDHESCRQTRCLARCLTRCGPNSKMQSDEQKKKIERKEERKKGRKKERKK